MTIPRKRNPTVKQASKVEEEAEEDPEHADAETRGPVNAMESDYTPERQGGEGLIGQQVTRKPRQQRQQHTRTNNPHDYKFPCECPDCDRMFQTKAAMKNHYRGDHSTFRFKCWVCRKEFARKDPVYRHVKLVHGPLYPTLRMFKPGEEGDGVVVPYEEHGQQGAFPRRAFYGREGRRLIPFLWDGVIIGELARGDVVVFHPLGPGHLEQQYTTLPDEYPGYVQPTTTPAAPPPPQPADSIYQPGYGQFRSSTQTHTASRHLHRPVRDVSLPTSPGHPRGGYFAPSLPTPRPHGNATGRPTGHERWNTAPVGNPDAMRSVPAMRDARDWVPPPLAPDPEVYNRLRLLGGLVPWPSNTAPSRNERDQEPVSVIAVDRGEGSRAEAASPEPFPTDSEHLAQLVRSMPRTLYEMRRCAEMNGGSNEDADDDSHHGSDDAGASLLDEDSPWERVDDRPTLPQAVLDIVARIDGVKRNEAGMPIARQLGIELKTELDYKGILRTGSVLRRYIGDERVFPRELWSYLLGTLSRQGLPSQPALVMEPGVFLPPLRLPSGIWSRVQRSFGSRNRIHRPERSTVEARKDLETDVDTPRNETTSTGVQASLPAQESQDLDMPDAPQAMADDASEDDDESDQYPADDIASSDDHPASAYVPSAAPSVITDRRAGLFARILQGLFDAGHPLFRSGPAREEAVLARVNELRPAGELAFDIHETQQALFRLYDADKIVYVHNLVSKV